MGRTKIGRRRGMPASLLVGLALLAPAPALAQRFEASTSGELVTYRTRAGGPIAERSTAYSGGSLAVWFGDYKIGVEGLFGSVPLGGDQSFALRATTLQTGVRSGALEYGIQAEARRRAAIADTSVLRMLGAYGRGTADFGAGFSGTAALAYYPVAQSLNDDPINLALRAEVGASFAPPGSRLTFFMTYRVLRLDYRAAGSTSARLEQDAGIMIGVGLGALNP